ncbi:MAG: hypothetical protein R3E68_21550 [Burkholderiaceae bacterium]
MRLAGHPGPDRRGVAQGVATGCERSLGLASEQAGAIRLLNEWGGQPLPVSASSWHDGRLNLRLSGARSVVDEAFARLANEHDAR